MSMPILAEESMFYWWQIPLVIALIGLIIFWKKYRDRQV